MALHSSRIHCLCLLKKQYLGELNDQHQNRVAIPNVRSSPTKARVHSFLFGSGLDAEEREYIIALRATSGVANTATVLAAVL